MSQEKVDRYKKEKKTRTRDIKIKKIKKAILIFILALGVGGLVGIPLGKMIYKYEKKKAEQNATISSLHYDEWFDEYWVDNYSDFFVGNTYEDDASATDAAQ